MESPKFATFSDAGHLHSLRQIRSFEDTTLVCADGRIQVHKIILSACSNWFKELLMEHQHDHSLIYFTGLTVADLGLIVKFMYEGEINIARDSINRLLSVADELGMRGLSRIQRKDNEEFEPCSSRTGIAHRVILTHRVNKQTVQNQLLNSRTHEPGKLVDPNYPHEVEGASSRSSFSSDTETETEELHMSRSSRCRHRYRSNIHEAISRIIPGNRKRIAKMEMSLSMTMSHLAGVFAQCSPKETQTRALFKRIKEKIFKDSKIGTKFKKKTDWNKAYELELTNYTNCQERWMDALKECLSFDDRIQTILSDRQAMIGLARRIEVKDQTVQTMDATTGLSLKDDKIAAKKRFCDDIKNIQDTLFALSNQDSFHFFTGGLSALLKLQTERKASLVEELAENTIKAQSFAQSSLYGDKEHTSA